MTERERETSQGSLFCFFVNDHSINSSIVFVIMKRKEKSGYQKRLESKRRNLEATASAPGQRKIFDFGLKKNNESSPCGQAARSTDAVEEQNESHFVNESSTEQETSTDQELSVTEEMSASTEEMTHQSQSHSRQGTQIEMWYKEKKLDASWLVSTNDCLAMKKQFVDKRNRLVIACLLCQKYEAEVTRYTINGRLPIASGVRADGKERLKSVTDHLESTVHTEAVKLDTHKQAWVNKSDKHPWAKYLKKTKSDKLQILLEMAIDVYNDSRIETVSAICWPSRSLSSKMATHLIQHFEAEGYDGCFIPYNPNAAEFRYRNPVIYAEMKKIIGDLEMKKLSKTLNESLCYSIQIDGSADRMQIDSKFITARYVPTDKICVKTMFLGVFSSDLGGADGLLDTFKTCLQSLGFSTENLIGLTTDGETANTGRHRGLWQLMKDFVGREILTVWCICHRSDLALESVQSDLPELSHWKSDAIAVATFFRTSPRRTKLLHKVIY